MLPCTNSVRNSKSAGGLTKTAKERWNIYDLTIMENDLLGGATFRTGFFFLKWRQLPFTLEKLSSSFLCCVPMEKGT